MRWLFIVVLFSVQPCFAVHNLIFKDAGDLTSGILPNERLDKSSVTMQGNQVTFSHLQSTISNVNMATGTLRTDFTNLQSTVANLTASTGTLFTQLQSTAVQLSNLQVAFSTTVTASTGTAAFNLIVTTHSNADIVVSSADFVNIMGAQFVNVSTYASMDRQGAGGIDAGAEMANAHYLLYFISNAAGTQVGCVLSTNTSRPNPMPSGYTKWRKMAPVKNTSSIIDGFIFTGSRVRYFDHQLVVNTATPATASTKLFTNVFVPTGTVSIMFHWTAAESAGDRNLAEFQPIGMNRAGSPNSAMYVGHDANTITINRIDLHFEMEVLDDKNRDFEYKFLDTIDQFILTITSYIWRP